MRPLLARGAEAGAMTSTGAVPLHFAAASGNVATIALLLDARRQSERAESRNGDRLR